MAKFRVRGQQLDANGLLVDNDRETLYGTIPVEHTELSKARAAVLELRTTGDWPDGRPHYWVEDEHGVEVETDWQELEETVRLARELLSW